MKVALISGSNRKESINSHLLRLVEQLNIEEMEFEWIDLNKFEIPMYNQDLEDANGIAEGVLQLNEKMQSYDYMVISTPEHNGLMPAFFKNITDWLSRIERSLLADKKVVVLSTSPGGRGGLSANESAVSQFKKLGANVVGSYAVPSFMHQIENGQLVENDNKRALIAALNALK